MSKSNTDGKMELTTFRAENFQRINLVEMEFTPGGGLTIIGGKNRSGKSSFLDAIAALISGPKAFKSAPVRDGADKAVLSGTIGDLEVTRTIKPDGSQKLSVKSPEGFTAHKPQTMLSQIVATVSIDPLEIMAMDAKKMAAMLKKLTGVDTSELDTEREQLFEMRTEVGRADRLLQGQLSGLVHHLGLPEKPDTAKILAEIEAITQHNASNQDERNKLGHLQADANNAAANMDVADKALAEAQEEYNRCQHVMFACDNAVHAQATVAKDLRDKSDVELKEALCNAEILRAEHADNEQHKAKKEELALSRKKYDSYTESIATIDGKREAMLAEADMPVDGLDFGDDGVTLNGLPLDMASGEEGFEACIRICQALNPHATFMLSKNGGKELDEDNLVRVGKVAEAFGLRLIVERPGIHDDNVIEIVDGYVKDKSDA